MKLNQEKYNDFIAELKKGKVIDEKFNEMIKYFYVKQAIRMKDIEKKILDYIYYNFDKIKFSLQINVIGVNPVFSLSRCGIKYAKDELSL